MSRHVVTIDPDEPVSRAAERLAEQDVGLLAVCGADHHLSAVITDRDIVVRTVAQGLDPERLTAAECGTKEPATVAPSETLEQAARRMDEQQVRRLLVIQAGRLVGIVSQSDLAAHGAHRRAGRLLERMARKGGDRRSAGWLLQRPYSEDGRYPPGSQPTLSTLAPLIDTAPPVYLAGYVIGVVLAALALLQLGAPL
jgi:predicted transcriptional regulator